jgi:hypothetical protein
VVDAKVIVIEPSDSQARNLETLLRFLDLEPIHVHDLAEFRRYDTGEPHDWLALLVGKETVLSQGPELVSYLRSMALPLPLIYLSSDGLPKLAENSGDLAWFHLDFPVKQRRLSWTRRKRSAMAIPPSRVRIVFGPAGPRARCAPCTA